MGAVKLLPVFVSLVWIIGVSQATHFRGGTISWKPLGGRKVQFDFKLGYLYRYGPGCEPGKEGTFVSRSTDTWACTLGCDPNDYWTNTVNYYCSMADPVGDWEYGQSSFTHTFDSDGPFVIGYSSWAWIKLSDGHGDGQWNISTSVDLRTRSDTSDINHSPVSQSKPLYKVQYNTNNVIKLPMADADDDNIRCRWATGSECISICRSLPGAVLDQETCTLQFMTSPQNGYIHEGIYAVALTVEDYPKSYLTLNGVKRTPQEALSQVAVQFLVQIAKDSNTLPPRFIAPTPKENVDFRVEEGDTFTSDLYTDNQRDATAKANVILLSGPVAMTKSQTTNTGTTPGGSEVFKSPLSWPTTSVDIGYHLVCANVQNSKGVDGEQRCFKVNVVPKGCKSLPCKNSGKCVSTPGGKYTCVCRPGFAGTHCEIDHDECSSNPCPPGVGCIDGANIYTCRDACNPSPCLNRAKCTLTPTGYSCHCVPEYTGINCQTEIPPTRPPTTPTTTTTTTTTTPTTTTTATTIPTTTTITQPKTTTATPKTIRTKSATTTDTTPIPTTTTTTTTTTPITTTTPKITISIPTITSNTPTTTTTTPTTTTTTTPTTTTTTPTTTITTTPTTTSTSTTTTTQTTSTTQTTTTATTTAAATTTTKQTSTTRGTTTTTTTTPTTTTTKPTTTTAKLKTATTRTTTAKTTPPTTTAIKSTTTTKTPNTTTATSKTTTATATTQTTTTPKPTTTKVKSTTTTTPTTTSTTPTTTTTKPTTTTTTPTTTTTTKPTTTTTTPTTTTTTPTTTTTTKPTTGTTTKPTTTTLPTTTNTIKASTTVSTTTKSITSTTPRTTKANTIGVNTNQPVNGAPCSWNYVSCKCVITRLRGGYGTARDYEGVSRIARDAIWVTFGLPFGLALAIFTYLGFHACRQRYKNTTRSMPTPKPGGNQLNATQHHSHRSTSTVTDNSDNNIELAAFINDGSETRRRAIIAVTTE